MEGTCGRLVGCLCCLFLKPVLWGLVWVIAPTDSAFVVAAAAVAVLSALLLGLLADVVGLYPAVLLVRPIAIAVGRGIASLHRDGSHRRLCSLCHS